MKILYASTRPPFPFFQGGAARSAHYLMSILSAEAEVGCLAVGSREFSGSNWALPPAADFPKLGISGVTESGRSTTLQCGYEVKVLDDFAAALASTIDEFSPDVVWAQLDGIDEVARIAHARGTKVLVYLRDAEDTPSTLKSLAAAGCGFVCNSHFMAGHLGRLTGSQAQVIYPSLESSFGVQGDPHGTITMINPFQVKGIDTLIEIARRMPEERFTIVESWTLSGPALQSLLDRLRDLPNVSFQHRVPDIGSIYQRTKLLLVPSVWEEAFGRVAIEAQSCGIPVIASQRGGLPESVGDGGVCVADYLNPQAWVQQIRRVLHDPAVYQALAGRALAHAADDRFTTRFAAQRMIDVCQDNATFRRPVLAGPRNWLRRLLQRDAA